MKRINLIGASGTGKTTLGKALAQALQCPHFDADAYYHLPTDPPFQQQRSPAERTRLFLLDLPPAPAWVLSGSVISWEPHPELSFDLIVFLRLPVDLRLQRLREREQALYGERIAPGGDMYEDHLGFMDWTAGYDHSTADVNNLQIHTGWLARQRCQVLTMAEPLTLEQQLEKILAFINL